MVTRIGKRVIVIGNSGSGKSTLAEELAEQLDRPFIELDALHWEPGWQMAEDEIFRERVRQAIQPESWVMAGNYASKQQDVSWPTADTIIWLDLPFATIMNRIIRRCWQRHVTQEDLWGTGNRESFWDHLKLWRTDDSLISFVAKTHRRRIRETEAEMNDPRWSHITFVRLKSPEAVNRLLQQASAHSDARIEIVENADAGHAVR